MQSLRIRFQIRLINFIVNFPYTLFLVFLTFGNPVRSAPRTMELNAAGALNSIMFIGENTGMLIKGMSGACLGINQFVDSIPCNPAFVNLNKEPRMMGSFAISNGYDNLEKASRLFAKKADVNTIGELLAGEQPLDIELTANITFFSPRINARYSPTHTQWHSLMVGAVNPTVNLWVYSSEMLSLQWGTNFSKTFYFGLQADVVKAKGINRAFRILELATDEGSHYLDPTLLNYASLKSGLAWQGEMTTLSLVVDKIGVPDKPEFGLTPNEVQGGVSVKVLDNLHQGRLDLVLDYKRRGPQFGIKYDYGVLSITGGLSEYGSTFGTFFFVRKMFSGILFGNTSLPWNRNDSINTIYTQFGIQL